MKHTMLILAATLISTVSYAKGTIPTRIVDAQLDLKTMDLQIILASSPACDSVASPQVVQDPKSPQNISIQAELRRHEGPGLCPMVMLEKHQTISLPTVVELNNIEILDNQVYVFHLEGSGQDLLVKGNQLKKSIQPQSANL